MHQIPIGQHLSVSLVVKRRQRGVDLGAYLPTVLSSGLLGLVVFLGADGEGLKAVRRSGSAGLWVVVERPGPDVQEFPELVRGLVAAL